MAKDENEDDPPLVLDQLLDKPELAEALGSDRFKRFLDHLPVAIAVSELRSDEHIVYANSRFHDLVEGASGWKSGQSWDILSGRSCDDADLSLGQAVVRDSDFVGRFELPHGDGSTHIVSAWSNLIEDEDGMAQFRLVALIDTEDAADRNRLEQMLREKDTLLRELQHRVKNNLQMITALIRLEARQASDLPDGSVFSRLAGRVEALALLYQALAADEKTGEVDLGSYLGQIASAVMQAQAIPGVRLELKADTWPVSVNIAMPAGLVVNELLTNALKYAFQGTGGTITLHCIVDEIGCKVVVADDGIGMPSEVSWPEPGKLSALIVQTLRENAHAQLKVESHPGRGTKVTIQFTRAAASVA